MDTKVKISIAVDEEIHKRLKYMSFDEKVTVQQIAEEALKRFLKPEEPEETNIEDAKRTIQRIVKRLVSEGNPLIIEYLDVMVRAIDRMSRAAEQEEPHDLPKSDPNRKVAAA